VLRQSWKWKKLKSKIAGGGASCVPNYRKFTARFLLKPTIFFRPNLNLDHEPEPEFTTEAITKAVASADSIDEAAAGAYRHTRRTH
jgi:hypothetical protein